MLTRKKLRFDRVKKIVETLFLAAVAGFASGADELRAPTPQVSIEELVKHINTRRFTAAEAEKLRETLRGLPSVATQYPAGGDVGKLSDELLQKTRAQYLQNFSRPAAFNYLRYLLFMHDAPSALAVLEKIGPASDADAAWLIAMSDVNLQLGDAERAKIYLSRASDLLGRDETLTLSALVAVTSSQGFRLYTPDTRVNFSANADLILYAEISHAQFRIVNGEYRCDLTFGLELRDDLGEIRDQNREYGRYEPNYAGAVREISATVYYRPPAHLPSGKYTLRLYVSDAVSGQRAQRDFAFALHGAANKTLQTERRVDAEGFQKALENNLWSSGDEQEDKTVRNLESMLRGMELSRDRSKMQGQLLNRD